MLEPAGEGVFETRIERPGEPDYVFVLDGDRVLPDPASRWQPDGLRGPSRLLEPETFRWTDGGWTGLELGDVVLYELHVGTFTAEGTLDAVIPCLRRLVELGVTAIELMPLATFAGRRNWGYDGVYPSAVHAAYGGPGALARLVDAAHAEGLAVVLDVVYNHIGPGWEALEAFGPYTSRLHTTPWGPAFALDGPGDGPVRELLLQSAEGWVRDFHLDGFRLDAVPELHDDSPRHLLAELAVRSRAAGRTRTLLFVEGDEADPRLRPERLDWGVDAWWVEDFHHALHALLTGERDGYYAGLGAVEDLAEAFRRPLSPALVVYGQNHDQIGNRAQGDRLPPAAGRVALLCTLFSPHTPLLFMGEEDGAQTPFQFFADHDDPAAIAVTRHGRRSDFAEFHGFDRELPDPQAVATFERSRLGSAQPDDATRALVSELLTLRATLPPGIDDVVADEDARILRVVRGAHELVCSFAERESRLKRHGVRLAVGVNGAELEGVELVLPPCSGAVLSPAP